MTLDMGFKLAAAIVLILLVVVLSGCASGARALSGQIPTAEERRCDYANLLATNIALDADASDDWRVIAELLRDVSSDECQG